MHKLRLLIFFVIIIAPALFGQTSNSISGVVTTATGTPTTATVRLVDLRRTTTADAQGRYTFTNVPPGRHLVQATSPRFGIASAEVDTTGPATADLRLDIPVHSEEIVVSAAPDARAASELAQPVERISDQELQARQQPTLGETLAQQPGVTSTGFVPGSSRPIIRGFGGDRIRILEDGVGTGDASNISQDHNVTIEPAGAESIEILRGPSTLLYGSNAVGGVVNVIDERVPMSKATSALSGDIELRGSSNANERTGHVALNGGGGMFAWEGSYNNRKTDDYETPIGKLINSDIDTKSGTVGGSLVGDRGFIGLSYNGYDTNYGVSDAGPGNEPEEVVRIDMRNRRWDLKSELGNDSGPLSRLRLHIGHTDYQHSEIPNGEIAATFLNKFTEGRLEASHRDLGALHGAIGVQYSDRDFSMRGEELLPPSTTKNQALFLFEEAGRGVWRLQFGGRYENQKTNVDSEDLPDRSFNGLSGSVGALWVPSAMYTAVLSVSHSARLPVAEELYFHGAHEATFQFEIGNPNLRKESGNGIDLSFRKRTGAITGDVSFFSQSFDGYIYQNPTGKVEEDFPVFEFAQRDATFRGAEGHADIMLLHAEPNHLFLEILADYVRATLANGGGSLPFIPPFRYGAGLRFQGQSLFALAEVRHANEQTHVAEFETTTPGYTLVNAALGYRFFAGNTIHDLMLRGNNLTDKLAYNHVNPLKDVVPLPGRDISLSYRLTF
ncbi:MAG TPA: TonB-dependent receptor [Thermoanaerobaculia bacterium]